MCSDVTLTKGQRHTTNANLLGKICNLKIGSYNRVYNEFKPTYIGVSGITFFNIIQDNISNLIHELFWDKHQTTRLCFLKSRVAYP